jgi:hypothetical protein
MLDPIIKIYLKGDDTETSKYIRDNINLTSTAQYGDYHTARINTGSLIYVTNQFEQGAYNLLDEMYIYEEKELLLDFITTLKKVYHICRKCHKWIVIHHRDRDIKRYAYPILFNELFYKRRIGKNLMDEIKSIYPDIYIKVTR